MTPTCDYIGLKTIVNWFRQVALWSAFWQGTAQELWIFMSQNLGKRVISPNWHLQTTMSLLGGGEMSHVSWLGRLKGPVVLAHISNPAAKGKAKIPFQFSAVSFLFFCQSELNNVKSVEVQDGADTSWFKLSPHLWHKHGNIQSCKH